MAVGSSIFRRSAGSPALEEAMSSEASGWDFETLRLLGFTWGFGAL